MGSKQYLNFRDVINEQPQRTLKIDRTSEENFNETSCSPDSYRRGRGQKVVGFSFYGDMFSQQSIDRGYFEGIGENLKLMPIYYPGTVKHGYNFILGTPK